jgi:hypothetical protein
MPQSIRCRISGPFPYLWLGMVVLFTLVGAPLIVVATIRGGTDAPPPFFAAAWIAILLWFWYAALVWISYEIRLSASGELEFKSVLRSVKIDARDVLYVGPPWGGLDPYTLVFRTSTKTARTVRQMDGLHSLIYQLRSVNPEIELKGV